MCAALLYFAAPQRGCDWLTSRRPDNDQKWAMLHFLFYVPSNSSETRDKLACLPFTTYLTLFQTLHLTCLTFCVYIRSCKYSRRSHFCFFKSQTRASMLCGTLAEGSDQWGGSAEELRGETGIRPQWETESTAADQETVFGPAALDCLSYNVCLRKINRTSWNQTRPFWGSVKKKCCDLKIVIFAKLKEIKLVKHY